MSNPKVFEFAKEIGMNPLALMDKIKEWRLPVKSHMAELEPEVLASIKQKMAEGKRKKNSAAGSTGAGFSSTAAGSSVARSTTKATSGTTTKSSAGKAATSGGTKTSSTGRSPVKPTGRNSAAAEGLRTKPVIVKASPSSSISTASQPSPLPSATPSIPGTLGATRSVRRKKADRDPSSSSALEVKATLTPSHGGEAGSLTESAEGVEEASGESSMESPPFLEGNTSHLESSLLEASEGADLEAGPIGKGFTSLSSSAPEPGPLSHSSSRPTERTSSPVEGSPTEPLDGVQGSSTSPKGVSHSVVGTPSDSALVAPLVPPLGSGESVSGGGGTATTAARSAIVPPTALSPQMNVPGHPGTMSPGPTASATTGPISSVPVSPSTPPLASGLPGASAGSGEAISASPSTGTAATQGGGTGVGPRKKEVTIGASGVGSDKNPTPLLGRKNIVGKMDLSRVQGFQRNSGSEGSSFGSGRFSSARAGGTGTQDGRRGSGGLPPRGPGGGGLGVGSRSTPPGGARGHLRTGFFQVSEPSLIEAPPVDDFSKKKEDSKRRNRPGFDGGASRGLDEQPPQFDSAEFRKREMVFQPKKKKGMLNRPSLQTQITKPAAHKRIIKIHGSMKINQLAQEMGLKATDLIKTLMKNGVMANINANLDFDTIALILPELGFEAQAAHRTPEELIASTVMGNLEAEPQLRSPVVTIMGHVDHGKTSLLDSIRQTNVAAKEAGGITQHIGAYQVKLEDGALITFLDTPGHEAFTAMRARGANVTDIAVIVVAADDGVMPQTIEAINHAKAAGVHIMIALNKIDKPGAQPDRIKQQLTEYQIIPEAWGGQHIFCEVSALKKTGIRELLEQIKLLAEILELKANPLRSATGTVIEARLDKGRGSVATLLVQDGTLKVGQSLVAGTVWGKVRSLMSDQGERISSVGPGTPVELLGLGGVPRAGDRFDVVKDEKTAEEIAQLRWDQRASEGGMTLGTSSSSTGTGTGTHPTGPGGASLSGGGEAKTGIVNASAPSGSEGPLASGGRRTASQGGTGGGELSTGALARLSLEEVFARVQRGEVKELNVVLKCDVAGSMEAIQGIFAKIATPEVKLKVIHSGIGGITESDVLLASTAKGLVIGFNVRPDSVALQIAKNHGVEIRTYSIVYELVDDMKKALTGLLAPTIVEKIGGRVEVRNTFSVPKIGIIAGCFVLDGKITRSHLLRLIRDGKIVYEGRIGSLKRFKDDAKEVAQGFECGVGIENFNDVKVGDIIETYTKEEVPREI